jgi:transposase
VVVIEATGNAASVAAVIGPHVGPVVVDPKQVSLIAHAKIKTDTIDAGVLAQLYASGSGSPTKRRKQLRRQVTWRVPLVRRRARAQPPIGQGRVFGIISEIY